VNVPKSASIAAMLDPDLAQALAGAQERAAVAGVQAVRRHARVRVTVEGRQQLVGVDGLEVAVFGHDGSREGDPHVHLHVQVGAKAMVDGQWRALAGRQMVAALGDWQATVTASLATDPAWNAAVARHGLTLTVEGGIAEIGPELEALFSRRHAAIEIERDTLLADFHRVEGVAPSARQLQWIDQQAWNRTRPAKGERAPLSAEQVRDTLLAAGASNVVRRLETTTRTAPAAFDRQDALAAAMEVAVQREVLTEDQLRLVAATGVAHAGGATDDVEAAITLTAGALRAQCVPARLPGGDDVWVPGPVMDAAHTVQDNLAAIRGTAVTQRPGLRAVSVEGLTPGQRLVAEAVAAGLPVVVEGPAGTGKTTALRRALAARNAAGLSTIAVAPSRVAVTQLGDGWTTATTAHGLLVAAGWTQDGGLWTAPVDGADSGLREAVIVVDEAGMLDLHTLAALTTHARTNGARVILVGDDRQLAPVGVAGGFALAKAGSDVVALTEAKRFTDPAHAALANRWRTGTDLDAIADDVLSAGLVRVHATEEDAQVALAETAAGHRNAVVMVADNATAVIVNRLTRAEHQHAGHVGPATGRLGRLGEDIGVGDLVQTRSNDRQLGVINRQRWTVTTIDPDGAMTLTRADQNPHAISPVTIRLDAGYVAAHVHRADAVTVHAAQGATADEGHALLDVTWTREQAYVALTRGRSRTVLHVVADDHDDARGLLVKVLSSSDTARAAALVAVTTQRAHEARMDVTPGIVDRIEAGLRRMTARVGAWGTTSALATDHVAPAAPSTTIDPDGLGL
jgi:hypothetical protein